MKTHAVMTRSTAALRPVLTVAGLIKRVVMAYQVSSERNDLADLDRRMLEDIGVTEAEASREMGRSFWDIPPGR